jgi:dienelactone hydrolase
MAILAHLVSLASGFALMGYGERPAADLLATSLAINVALAPLTALIAYRRGRSVARWAVLGFCFGGWALVAELLLLTNERRTSSPPTGNYPPTSHAA